MKRKAECICSETVICYKMRLIPVFRHYPKGCSPRGRFATQSSQHLVQSESPSSSSLYDSESEDSVVSLFDDALESVSLAEVKGKDVSQALDTPSPVDQSETSDHEATELPEEVVSESMPTGYAPREGVLAIRDYPRSCGPKGKSQTPFSKDLESEGPDSSLWAGSELGVCLSKKGLDSITSAERETPKALDDIEHIDLKETSESLEEAKLVFSSSWYDLESEDSMASIYNNNLESVALSEEEQGIDMPKVIDSMGLIDQSETSEPEAPSLPPKTIDLVTMDSPEGCIRRCPQVRDENILEATTFETNGLNHELSDAEDPSLIVLSDSEGSCSTNTFMSNLQESENLSGQCSIQFQEKGPSTMEYRVPKLIITVWMAARNCPWRERKRASRSNTTRDGNRSKRKKH
ncbi:uncharacterized protein LOC110429294 [Herrania umbratica]|uniref:Uncharacterized protein LOC110429294 n=1 Tax=Herrania umbratica TaxID=108875 RepID=A0A6J1BRT5_9ROSI|nr:uncharacterized protein LOC110429294 [Herrania umbratica]